MEETFLSEPTHGASTDELMDRLRKIDVFEGLPAGDLARIADIVAGVGGEGVRDADVGADGGFHAVSRVLQAVLLPAVAPRVEGFDVAAGTTTEETGRGGSVWDWVTLRDGRIAFLTLDVRQEGLPPAHLLGVARTVIRGLAADYAALPEILAKANEALSAAALDGFDQFVEVGMLVARPDGVEWASAGRVPGGVIRRGGALEEFEAHGPPLGMLGGFKYSVQEVTVSAGDAVLVLSHASHGLFLGAADLVAQLHGKPSGELVTTLHRTIRQAHGDERTETSVLYARKH